MADNFKLRGKLIILGGVPLTLPIASSDPGVAVAGDMYFNDVSNKVRIYGVSWGDLGSGLTGASLNQYNIIVGNGSNSSVAVDTNSAGDILADSTLGLTIKTGVIVNADVNATANIDYSKLANLGAATNRILVANGSDKVSAHASILAGDLILRDGSVAFTANQSMGGNKLVSLATPTAASDAATKGYVDAFVEGLNGKKSCKAASTGNLTLSGNQTVDGVALVDGDRVLVKNQTASEENGIYVVDTGAWSRSTDMDTWSEVPSAYSWVEEGTTYADTAWVCISNQGGTIGVTAIDWAQYSSSAGGANKALSNLNATSINQDLVANANDALDIGSDANEWRTLWSARLQHNDSGTPTLTIATTGNNGNIDISPNGTGVVRTKGIVPLSDLAYNLGSTTLHWNGIFTQQVAAAANDLLIDTIDTTSGVGRDISIISNNGTNDPDVNTGDILIKTGDTDAISSLGSSGNIRLVTGAVLGGTAGYISLESEGRVQVIANTTFEINAAYTRLNPFGTLGGQTGTLYFQELAANGVASVGFRAPDAISTDVLWTLPAADGSSGYVLTTNGLGVLSWSAPAATGANTSLSNLIATSINQSLVPNANLTLDVGSDANEWANLWSGALLHNDSGSPDLAISVLGNNGNIAISPHGTGVIQAGKTIHPTSDLTLNLGADSLEWAQLWTGAINHNDSGSPDLDISTTGNNGNIHLMPNGTGKIALGRGISLDVDNGYDSGTAANSWKDTYTRRVLTNASSTALTLEAAGATSNVEIKATSAILRQATYIGTSEGSGATDYMEEQYFDALTLAANTSTPTAIAALTFDHSVFRGCMIEYTIREASSDKQRTGKMMISTDGVNTSSPDTFGEVGILGDALGLELTTQVSGSDVEVLYNNTHASNACTMRCKVTRFRA